MTSLTLFGGVAQIGGNKIEIKDKRTRLFFDFGEPFGLGEDYYVDWLGPRGIYGLKDYFEFGLIPQIKGVFSKDALKYTTLKYTKPTVDAIFISHCHFDHVSHLRFVDESIPVYLGETTKKIMDAWAETTTFGNFGEHDWHTFKTGDRIKIKNIKVEPIHVDHSIPAAYGFIINTTKGPIVYTGDFRQHGTRPDLTHDFLKRAKQVKPVAMVCEGTRMAPEEDRVIYTEKGVKRESNKILKNSNKLVVTTFYGRDVDRMRTFYEVAKNNRRKFVVSVRTAVLLKKLNEETDIKIPHPLKDKNIKIYFRRKRSGTYAEQDYYKWERPLLENSVCADYIRKNQSKVLLCLNFSEFTELIDIKPKKGSHFIHSMSEPFTEEDIQEEVMNNWLEHFGMKFHQIHASGHCSRVELEEIIKDIKPKVLIPIHTENPRMFEGVAEKCSIPIVGNVIKVD